VSIEQRALDLAAKVGSLTAERDALLERCKEQSMHIADAEDRALDAAVNTALSVCDDLQDRDAKIDSLTAERDALKAFKTFVHAWLDTTDVPRDPPGEHSDRGCRVGQRLVWLRDAREAAIDRWHDAVIRVGELLSENGDLTAQLERARMEPHLQQRLRIMLEHENNYRWQKDAVQMKAWLDQQEQKL